MQGAGGVRNSGRASKWGDLFAQCWDTERERESVRGGDTSSHSRGTERASPGISRAGYAGERENREKENPESGGV